MLRSYVCSRLGSCLRRCRLASSCTPASSRPVLAALRARSLYRQPRPCAAITEQSSVQIAQHEDGADTFDWNGHTAPVAAVSQQLSAAKQAAERIAGSSGASTSVVAAGALELPPPTNVRVKTAEYKTSSVKLSQCPAPELPEFAVIGRSNVGKSSLINLLTNHKKLALVSKTPGKTRCINHFLINNSWYLVDLPGYGYAKTSKGNRLDWNQFTKDYFLNRESLVNVMLLVDGSVPMQAIDLDCATWLANAEVPYTLVFTKTDKRKKKSPAPRDNMRAFQEELMQRQRSLPVTFATSATNATGGQELLTFIAQLRELYLQGGND